MPRAAVKLSCTGEVMAELERLARSRSGEARLAARARIVLACLQGKRNDEVASELGVRPNTVGQWRRRFAERGLAGLHDAPRSGKPARYGVELRDRILAQLELPPPAGMAGWDGGSLALALGVSDHAVWRILRKQGIQLRHQRPWCGSTEAEFVAKTADVIGLYLSPQQHALVLGVDDEKALPRAQEDTCGPMQTGSGKIVQAMGKTPERRTVSLFAALSVATGVICGKTTRTGKRTDFQTFMEEVIADQPAERRIHVILDHRERCTMNGDWLAAHPNTTFHFMPDNASWLKQLEIWFGIFQCRTQNNASLPRIEQIVAAIGAFIDAHEGNSAPFVWRKHEVRGAQPCQTIDDLCNHPGT